jgi:Flp pilus assembly protein TadD
MALLTEQDGDFAEAERVLRQTVEMEDKLPIAFGPPTIDKPTYELLGEFLLRRGRKEEAHAEFERAVARTPGRRLTDQGFAATAGSKPLVGLR